MCTYEMYLSNWNTEVTNDRSTSNQPRWLKIKIKHGGNQDIPELADGKSIHFEMSETKTINDLKKEIELKVKNAPKEKQSLRGSAGPTIFGESYNNNVRLGDITIHSLNTLHLFIELKNY